MFQYEIDVHFGDCDPVGIVFYPNYFRWFDACYHYFLRDLGIKHSQIQEQLDCFGTGLMDVGANFRAPVRHGARLAISVAIRSWEAKSFTLGYTGSVEGRTVVKGHEMRGLFGTVDNRLVALPVAPLKAMFEDRINALQPGQDQS